MSLNSSQIEKIERLIISHGYMDFLWINPKKIIVANWVRMKCKFGCPDYGRNASCPPNTLSIEESCNFFAEYNHAVLFHFSKAVDKPEDRGPWAKKMNNKLLKLEREIFLSGYQKAFLLFMDNCRLCTECAGDREHCEHPKQARPSPEGMAVDVFSTVRQFGYPIEVLENYSKTMNRYAFLLVD